MKVLLTGAGFSHNFCGPLADGMWAKLYNHPEVAEIPRIREALRGDFDYEAVFTAIANNSAFIETCILKGMTYISPYAT